MKNSLLLFFLIFSLQTMFSQETEESTNPTDKGHYIVDGSVYFSTNNSTSESDGYKSETDSFSMGLSPKAAYFVIDRLAIGLEASVGFTDFEHTNSEGTKYSSNSRHILIGPFMRYYLSNGLFGQASLGFGTTKSKQDDFEDNKSDSFRSQIGIGYAFFIGPQVSIEPLVSYHFNKTTHDISNRESTSNGFRLGAGFTIYI
ncbi:MAG: autotransporter outer membrane beta-barrel domain-containing protein [Flavobacteriaceae bacterium]|nr:autotransporter outer membrane beta-barrel domain-containing protein [Flavobacteriaceae bacterium]